MGVRVWLGRAGPSFVHVGARNVAETPQLFGDVERCVDELFQRIGKHLVVAAPLGVGKPNVLLNALYRRAVADPGVSLHLYTALSLERPRAKSGLEKRFLEPFLARHFGADYPDLDYVAALHAGRLPANVRISEFYLQSGAMLGAAQAQRHYISLNYTHVARDVAQAGINLIVHLIARRVDAAGARYSLSSNPDVTLDMLDRMVMTGQARPYVAGMIHPDLPFLGNDAEVPGGFFDGLIEDGRSAPALFALPREQVSDSEYAIGLNASSLVRDGGTLQIGIGALSDALVYAILLRHQSNPIYRRVMADLNGNQPPACDKVGSLEAFERGLYGASEMVMDGFMHLAKAGVLKRRVYDDLPLEKAFNNGVIGETLAEDSLERLLQTGTISLRIDSAELSRLQYFGLLPEDIRLEAGRLLLANGEAIDCDLTDARARCSLAALMAGRRMRNGRYLHGAFYLGSKDFYAWLRGLNGDDFDGLCMTRVSHINELYGGAEALHAEQRRDARFFNTCMMHTLLGAATSDTLENGQVVSGVGGQYNFVAMAHALAGGRSILMLRSVRNSNGRAVSNILWNYGHTTIPRHLRDIVITEYGIADLRGRSDEECVKAMLAISDARFQEGLMRQAKEAGKLAGDYRLPDWVRGNSPQRIADVLNPIKTQHGLFGRFPFGSDFTQEEWRLLQALTHLRDRSTMRLGKMRMMLDALLNGGATPDLVPLLQRMRLDSPRGFGEHMLRRFLILALRQTNSSP